MTIDELKAYKRKAKAQRDNWKARALAIEQETRDRIARYCWEQSGYFASDTAARMFADNIMKGYYAK